LMHAFCVSTSKLSLAEQFVAAHGEAFVADLKYAALRLEHARAGAARRRLLRALAADDLVANECGHARFSNEDGGAYCLVCALDDAVVSDELAKAMRTRLRAAIGTAAADAARVPTPSLSPAIQPLKADSLVFVVESKLLPGEATTRIPTVTKKKPVAKKTTNANEKKRSRDNGATQRRSRRRTSASRAARRKRVQAAYKATLDGLAGAVGQQFARRACAHLKALRRVAIDYDLGVPSFDATAGVIVVSAEPDVPAAALSLSRATAVIARVLVELSAAPPTVRELLRNAAEVLASRAAARARALRRAGTDEAPLVEFTRNMAKRVVKPQSGYWAHLRGAIGELVPAADEDTRRASFEKALVELHAMADAVDANERSLWRRLGPIVEQLVRVGAWERLTATKMSELKHLFEKLGKHLGHRPSADSKLAVDALRALGVSQARLKLVTRLLAVEDVHIANGVSGAGPQVRLNE
jgi:hypothetical protein